ncbi:MAG: DUF2062 domain-containing protein [Candidatus Omnitrophica bacterium]|nr:DUF2062 domain-containing protein [Candidatus Omnitrophota bacterium]
MFKIRSFFKFIGAKLFKINDTPQKIALGFGLGVFSGIFPGTGPAAALFLALLLRGNRASALLGSIITNTWFSLVLFLASVKIGAFLMGIDWYLAHKDWDSLFSRGIFSPASYAGLFKFSTLKIILPVILGYCAIALLAALISYLTVLMVLTIIHKKHSKNRQ